MAGECFLSLIHLYLCITASKIEADILGACGVNFDRRKIL